MRRLIKISLFAKQLIRDLFATCINPLPAKRQTTKFTSANGCKNVSFSENLGSEINNMNLVKILGRLFKASLA